MPALACDVFLVLWHLFELRATPFARWRPRCARGAGSPRARRRRSPRRPPGRPRTRPRAPGTSQTATETPHTLTDGAGGTEELRLDPKTCMKQCFKCCYCKCLTHPYTLFSRSIVDVPVPAEAENGRVPDSLPRQKRQRLQHSVTLTLESLEDTVFWIINA